jgi:hypothetical protein
MDFEPSDKCIYFEKDRDETFLSLWGTLDSRSEIYRFENITVKGHQVRLIP